MRLRYFLFLFPLAVGCTEQQEGAPSSSGGASKTTPSTSESRTVEAATTDPPTTIGHEQRTPDDLKKLVQIAAEQEARRDYLEAIQSREQILVLIEQQFGRDSWQATNARLSIENTQRKSRLTDQQRKVLDEIGRLEIEAAKLTSTGQLPAAIDAYSRVLQLTPQVFPARSIAIADYTFRKAQVHLAAEQYQPAEEPYKLVLSIQEQLLGRHHPDYARTLNAVGVLYLRTGRHEEAESALLQAADLTEKIWGKDSADHAVALNNLGTLRFETGRYSDAQYVLQRALEIRRKHYGDQHFYYADTLYNLGMVYLATQEFESAIPHLEKAANIYEKDFGRNHAKTIRTIGNLAVAYRWTKQYAKAESLLKRVIDPIRSKFGPSYESTISNAYLLGVVLGYQAKYKEAEPHLAQALRGQERLYGTDDPRLLPTLRAYAVLLDRVGRKNESGQMVSRVESIESRTASKRSTHPASHR